MPIHGFHTPQPNRTNANPTASAEKADRSKRQSARARKVELYHGKIEGALDNAEKHAGLTRTQYKCRKKAADIDAGKFPRGRSKSKRAEERQEARERHYQANWAEHDATLRRTMETKDRERKARGENKRKIYIEGGKGFQERKTKTKEHEEKHNKRRRKRSREEKINKTAADEKKNRTRRKKGTRREEEGG